MRTILIDADILAFQIASSQEQVFEFNGEHVLHADLKAGIREVKNAISWIIETTSSHQAALFLTGSDNFRKGVLPSYKANRVGVRKPMILSGLRRFMQEEFSDCYIEDKLEGDDLIGMFATQPHDGERVIFSADKDLLTIPALHWDPEDGEVFEQVESVADRMFFSQVLTGDATDNYKGCPGCGPVKAEKVLEGKTNNEERWQAVLETYRKAGLTEKDALTQARCARILRHGEYDFETKKVTLWSPQ